MYSGDTTEYMMLRGTGKTRPLIVVYKQAAPLFAAGLQIYYLFQMYYLFQVYLISSSAICTAFVAAPFLT